LKTQKEKEISDKVHSEADYKGKIYHCPRCGHLVTHLIVDALSETDRCLDCLDEEMRCYDD
jgi:hypothetical protein